MNRSLSLLALAAIASACNTTIRAGSSGGSNDGRFASAIADASAPSIPPAPPPPEPPPPPSLPEASAPSAAGDAGVPLVARCPGQFSEPRFARCKWSTGMYRYCGGAAPLAGDDQPREGCVCNECVHDGDCTARRAGRCVEFGDEACGPPAHSCVYAGDPCGAPSGCKAPNRCVHDRVGHVACVPPRIPHM